MSYLQNVLKTKLKKKIHDLHVFTSVKEGGNLTRKPDEDILVSLVGLPIENSQEGWTISLMTEVVFTPSLRIKVIQLSDSIMMDYFFYRSDNLIQIKSMNAFLFLC